MAAIALHSWFCLFMPMFVRKLALCFVAQHMSQHRVMLLFFASGAYNMFHNDLACAFEDSCVGAQHVSMRSVLAWFLADAAVIDQDQVIEPLHPRSWVLA